MKELAEKLLLTSLLSWQRRHSRVRHFKTHQNNNGKSTCATRQMCVTINCSPALQTYVHFCYDLLLRSDSTLFKNSSSKKGTLRSCFRLCGFALTIATTVMTTTLYNYWKPLSTHSMLNSITSATNNVQIEEKKSHTYLQSGVLTLGINPAE